MLVELCITLSHPVVVAVAVQSAFDVPVWRQLLWLHLDGDDREVAEKAATYALAEA